MSSPGLDAKPIVGYSDPMCVAPGEPISFMVSTSEESFEASVVRLRHGDPEPGGPGLRYEELETSVDGTYPGKDQPLPLGSYMAVEPSAALEPESGFTLQAWIYPTTPEGRLRGIVTRWAEEDERGYGLFLEAEGGVSLRLDGEVFRCRAALRSHEWAFVRASWDAETGNVTVEQSPLSTLPDDPAAETVSAHASTSPAPSDLPLVVGGHVSAGGPRGAFNGKVDSPRLYGRALTAEEVQGLASNGPPDAVAGLLAAWDFAKDTDDDDVEDVSGHGHHGRTVNHPTRAVTGRNWTGEEVAFLWCPEQYNAVGFHDDDLEDACWEPAFTFTPPQEMRSGIYAVRLTTDSAEDWVPFFVRPPRGTATAPVVFLAPTMSYLAYANEHTAAIVLADIAPFDITEHYQDEDRYSMAIPLTGLYEHHTDDTGVCYSSWRRPNVTMRPHYHTPAARSAHQLCADLHIIDWLEEKGIAYDVVTDHDLHHEGRELLDPYRVVLTGTHPEYWSGDMLDSLDAYLDRGGKLMYLGGNGFYWVTSVSPSRPHLIEVRRGRRGPRNWESDPGEDYHSTTGEHGGLWRDRGRAPQRIGGVGMTAQGFVDGVGYRRMPDSYLDEVAWVFDGVEGDEIGTGGLVLNAPAGFEIDRLDHRLGTPANAKLLASAQHFPADYQHVVEEVLSSDSKQSGDVSPLVRADVVYFEREGGGAVFATGSIAWCGSLSQDGYEGAVSRVTENVVRRFSEP